MHVRRFASLIVLLTACGGEAPQGASPEPPAEPAEVHEPVRAGTDIYDAEGNLRESGEEIAALPLPMGLELEYEDRGTHAFHSQAPVAKVLRFFGPRLSSGQVERLGEGATYRQALPRHPRGSQVRLDVTIAPSSRGGTSVRIHEVPTEPVNPPSLEELRRQYESDPNNLM